MWTSLNKKFYLFLSIIFVIGLILGVIFLIYLDEASKDILFLNINEWLQGISNSNINNIVLHIIMLSSMFLLSIFLIGIPFVLFFVFYNGFSVGFTVTSLISIFGIKGLLYGIIYVIITKGIYLFFLSIIIVSLLRVSLIILKSIFNKENIDKEKLALLLKKNLICIVIILINDIILYFWGTNLITIFNFLLN